MADFFGGSTQERDPGAYVPPPPNEISIRTLDSDVKSMALSGGNFTQSQRVVLPTTNSATAFNRKLPSSGGFLKMALWVGLAFLVLSAFVYFLYPLFSSPYRGGGLGGATSTTSTTTPELPSVPPSITIPNFEHESFFRRRADKVLEMKFNYPATSVSDLETYTQKVFDLLQGDKSTSSLFEVEVKNGGGRWLALSQFFKVIGANFLPEDFWAENFEPDFTLFVFKNKDGFWPGVVAQLGEGKSWLILKSQITQLERSSDFEKFFVTTPGSRFGNFEDKLISGQPARSLKYSKSSAEFIYGWFHNYMVISTSLDGLKEAIGRL